MTIITQAILQQLSGTPNTGRLTMMLGAQHFYESVGQLQFKWKAKSRNGANTVVIRLDPSDTYTVEFWSVRGAKTRKVSEYHDIYNDSLRNLFESETGLRTSM